MKNAWAFVLMLACTGAIGDPGAERPPTPDGADTDVLPGETTVPIECGEADDRAGPARAWRLTSTQYQRTAQRFVAGRRDGPLPEVVFSPVFSEKDPLARFSNLASSYSMTGAELRQALDAARAVAVSTIGYAAENGASCVGPEYASCVRDSIQTRGAIAFGRPLTDAELQRYTSLAVDSRATLGDDDALALAYEALLANPETLFRLEVGRGVTDGDAARLDGFEIARALSYSLLDAPPDDPLWSAALGGELDTDEGVATHVDRILGELSQHAPTHRFLREYFGFDKAVDVIQEADATHRPALLVQDTERFVAEVLAEASDDRFVETLLSADFAFARSDTQASYGLSGLGGELERVVLPEERRGLMLQPAWLASFARTGETDPIHRGRFISESLLCREIPQIPIGIDPVIPEVPGATMRERLAVHTVGPCADCHALMDPIGLSLEAFDHFGRFRTEELGEPVDVSGTLTGADTENGSIDGGRDLVERLARSEVVRACFVRHAFRYWMGRDEREGDGCALANAYEKYEGRGSYRDLVRSLFVSRSFLWRERGD